MHDVRHNIATPDSFMHEPEVEFLRRLGCESTAVATMGIVQLTYRVDECQAAQRKVDARALGEGIFVQRPEHAIDSSRLNRTGANPNVMLASLAA
jgi:hypothetical protein